MTMPLLRKGQVIAQLNVRWRVTYDAAQWILEVRKGVGGQKDSGYRQKSFCCWRTTLLARINEYCGRCRSRRPQAIIQALPEVHPRIERLRRECRS